jgi:hypothetical protein
MRVLKANNKIIKYYLLVQHHIWKISRPAVKMLVYLALLLFTIDHCQLYRTRA